MLARVSHLSLSNFSKQSLLVLQSRSFASMEQIKELRAMSGAPIMDCKKALEAAETLEGAFEWLREHGLSKITAKAKLANEGLLGLWQSPSSALLLEVNSETDFVARNEDFQHFVVDLLRSVADHHTTSSTPTTASLDVEAMLSVPSMASGNGTPLKDVFGDMVSKIRENLSLKRGTWVRVSPDQQALTSYMHGSLYASTVEEGTSLNLGSQCTLSTFSVPASTLAENKQLASDVHKLNMHITAAKPKYHKVSDVPTEMIEHEKDIILKQMDDGMKGKPAQVLEKIVAGKLNKFYQEVVLEEQAHMLSEESNMTIKKELDRLGVDITDYIQWQVGEEQEVQEEQ